MPLDLIEDGCSGVKKLRAYIDTSVVGGCLDDEFANASRALLGMARRGEVTLVLSDLLAVEVSRAPQGVRDVFDSLPDEWVEIVTSSSETERMRDMYLTAGVVGTASVNDAHHVAIATVYQVDMVVSWNFRHIVHFDKIRAYNSVNLREGYGSIEIRTPRELV